MLSPTKRKYIFTIYELGNTGNSVRSTDISNALGVKKASVSLMLPKLIRESLVERTESGGVALTSAGAVLGGELYLKYLTLFKFFKEVLKSTDENARRDSICCLCALTDENTESMTNYILKQHNIKEFAKEEINERCNSGRA